MMALLDRVSRIRAGLAKTAQHIRQRLTGVREGVGEGPPLAPQAAAADQVSSLEAVEEALLSADVGVSAAHTSTDSPRSR